MATTLGGLSKVEPLKPGRGYWETVAGLSRAKGPEVSSEVGWRMAPGHSLFARGYASREDYGVGAGWRWEW